jgi:ribosomal protein L11 methyltransferase
MSNSIQLTINTSKERLREELIGRLSLLEFNGFEERDDQLLAFYNEGEIDEEELEKIISQYGLSYSKSVISDKNWNEVWESSFAPVIVDDFCCVRADFHKPVDKARYEIIITPKMSFGTGHHATTYLMLEQMSKMDFNGKSVVDFGTGTGILAIMAEKLGSRYVYAIDNDPWSIENARENVERNVCKLITVENNNTFIGVQKYDVILANINKNVIVGNFSGLVFGLHKGGKMLMSGLLKKDEQDLLLLINRHNMVHMTTVEKDGWISILATS